MRFQNRQHMLAMTIPNMFHYSNYWGTWSRVLNTYDSKFVIELNLTPINPMHKSVWDEFVKPVVFREHCTSLDAKDKLVAVLPDEVFFKMVDHLEVDFINELIHTDWLSLIDIELLRKHSNGGCPLNLCRKK